MKADALRWSSSGVSRSLRERPADAQTRLTQRQGSGQFAEARGGGLDRVGERAGEIGEFVNLGGLGA